VLSCLERLELFLYDRAAHIVAQTPAFRDDLTSRGVDPEKISVVLNGVEISVFEPRPRDSEKARELGVPGDRMVIGYLGTLGMAHALDNVLDAAEKLRDEPFCFLLMGPGAEREKLMSEVRRRALGNVVMAPPQPKTEMPRAWSVCDLSLVHLKNTPVFSTVIPSKIFESMAMEKPVVLAAPAGEASRLIEAERTGRTVEAGDPDRLAETIRALAHDEQSRTEMSENSRRAVRKYSRERQASEMLKALERSLTAQG
jgi:glycosyltransferase involved in cell wall biosynthesis